MKTAVTIADILAYGPCSVYTPKRLAELFNGRESMSMEEILATDIPSDHKLDCILRSGLVPKEAQDKLKKHVTDTMSSDGKTPAQKGTIADTRNRYAERATRSSTEAAAAIVLSHADKFEEGWTRDQRRSAIEGMADTQLKHLLTLLKGNNKTKTDGAK